MWEIRHNHVFLIIFLAVSSLISLRDAVVMVEGGPSGHWRCGCAEKHHYWDHVFLSLAGVLACLVKRYWMQLYVCNVTSVTYVSITRKCHNTIQSLCSVQFLLTLDWEEMLPFSGIRFQNERFSLKSRISQWFKGSIFISLWNTEGFIWADQ